MSRWLTKFLEKKSELQSDKPDRFNPKTNMSVLSVMSGPSGELLEQNLGKLSELQPDKPDRFNSNTNMSVMSGLSGLSGPSLRENFEERLAIAEYDGQQTPLQAQRIAYLDAFISILFTLAEDDPHQDWLAQKIQTALATLETQNFSMLN